MRTYETWYENVWNMAKQRFLQSEASLWLISNKKLEVSALIGAGIWVYFEVFVSGDYESVQSVGAMIALFATLNILQRVAFYNGYASGYERGFADAATRSLDYQNEDSFKCDLDTVLSEIQDNEEKANSENKRLRWQDRSGPQILDRALSEILGTLIV